jgi:hypothetical protein
MLNGPRCPPWICLSVALHSSVYLPTHRESHFRTPVSSRFPRMRLRPLPLNKLSVLLQLRVLDKILLFKVDLVQVKVPANRGNAA